MKSFFQILILAVTMMIMACNQSPTNTQSDPIRNYNGLKNDVPASRAGHDTNDPAKVDDGVPVSCEKPYSMIILNSEGKAVGNDLQFTVGKSKTYQIQLSSDQYPDMKITPINAPKGMSPPVEKSPGIWSLTFQPTADQGNIPMKMVLKVNVPQDGCIKGAQGETLHINVDFGSPLPKVSVLNLDKPLYNSTDTVTFQIDVNDPSVADGQSPQIPLFDFLNNYKTGETVFANAKNGVSCNRSTKIDSSTYRFNCICDFNQIKPEYAEPQPFAHTDFEVFARSANNQESKHLSIGLNIIYPKPPEAPVADTPKPVPSDSAAKPSNKKTSSTKSKPKTASSKDSKSTTGPGDNT